MHFSSVASVALLATEALALPRPESAIKKRSIKVPVTHFRKTRSLEARADGNETASNDGGGWLLQVSIGGQTVTLNMDTGSSDLWTASTEMPADQQASVQTENPVYDPSQSTTFQTLDGENFDITYGDGSGASGPEGVESITIGGANVPNMPFGVCSDLRYGPGESTRNSDGPVGLGFQSLNSVSPDKQPTFMEALIPYVDQPIFTTYLTTDASGFVLFGTTDPSLSTGDLTSITINNSSGFWIAPQVSFGANGQQFSSAPLDLILDTGGAGFDIPSDAQDAYFANVPGAVNNGGSYSYPCGTALPDFDLFFSGVNSGPSQVTIPGAALENGSGPDGAQCGTWIGVASSSPGSLGIPFFASQYIEWHQADPSLTFGPRS